MAITVRSAVSPAITSATTKSERVAGSSGGVVEIRSSQPARIARPMIPTALTERVDVSLSEVDGEDEVVLVRQPGAKRSGETS